MCGGVRSWAVARGGEADMIAVDPKHRSARADVERDEARRRQLDEQLDEALKNTFPASDPVAMEQPAPASCLRRALAAHRSSGRPSGLPCAAGMDIPGQ